MKREELDHQIAQLGYIEALHVSARRAKDCVGHCVDAKDAKHHERVAEIINRAADAIQILINTKQGNKLPEPAPPPPPEPSMSELIVRASRRSDNWPNDSDRSPQTFRFKEYERGALGLGCHHDYFIFPHSQAKLFLATFAQKVEELAVKAISPHIVAINDANGGIVQTIKPATSFRLDGNNAILVSESGEEVGRVDLSTHSIKVNH